MYRIVKRIALVLMHTPTRPCYGVIVGSTNQDPRTHEDIEEIARLNPGFEKTKVYRALQEENAWFDVVISDNHRELVDEDNANIAFRQSHNYSVTWEHF